MGGRMCRERILFLAKLIYICIFIRFLYSLYLQIFKYLKDFVFESIGGIIQRINGVRFQELNISLKVGDLWTPRTATAETLE